MKKLEINISTKNIGFSAWNQYMAGVMEATEDLIIRMRWKLIFKKKEMKEKGRDDDREQVENEEEDISLKFFGFRTTQSP